MTLDAVVSPAISKRALGIIFLTVFIDLLGFGIVLPLLPRYGRHFGASGFELGLLMASFSAMQFLFSPLWGRLSDRIGRRPVLLVGLLGSTIFYTAFGYITQNGSDAEIAGLSAVTWLFITRIGAGISGATISTAQAYIADVTGRENRSRGMALIGAAFGMGFTFGPLLGAFFASNQIDGAPSAMPGYLAGGLSGVAFLLALLTLPESRRQPVAIASEPLGNAESVAAVTVDESANSGASSVLAPAILILLAAGFTTTFAFAQFESTLSLLTDKLGVTDQGNFFVFAYIGLVLTIAQGALVRRMLPIVGEFRMAVAGVALMTLGLGLIAYAGTQSSLMILYLVLPVCVVGYSATTPSLQGLLSLATAKNSQGYVLGLGQSGSSLARICGPLVGLSLQDAGIALPYMLASGVMGISAILLFAIPPTRRR